VVITVAAITGAITTSTLVVAIPSILARSTLETATTIFTTSVAPASTLEISNVNPVLVMVAPVQAPVLRQNLPQGLLLIIHQQDQQQSRQHNPVPATIRDFQLRLLPKTNPDHGMFTQIRAAMYTSEIQMATGTRTRAIVGSLLIQTERGIWTVCSNKEIEAVAGTIVTKATAPCNQGKQGQAPAA
jgi:hypothetical protein